jgi:hypothetical protein
MKRWSSASNVLIPQIVPRVRSSIRPLVRRAMEFADQRPQWMDLRERQSYASGDPQDEKDNHREVCAGRVTVLP